MPIITSEGDGAAVTIFGFVWGADMIVTTFRAWCVAILKGIDCDWLGDPVEPSFIHRWSICLFSGNVMPPPQNTMALVPRSPCRWEDCSIASTPNERDGPDWWYCAAKPLGLTPPGSPLDPVVTLIANAVRLGLWSCCCWLVRRCCECTSSPFVTIFVAGEHALLDNAPNVVVGSVMVSLEMVAVFECVVNTLVRSADWWIDSDQNTLQDVAKVNFDEAQLPGTGRKCEGMTERYTRYPVNNSWYSRLLVVKG